MGSGRFLHGGFQCASGYLSSWPWRLLGMQLTHRSLFNLTPIQSVPSAPANEIPGVTAAPNTEIIVDQPIMQGTILPGSADYGRPRGLFESDREFCRFIAPISNPILAKDPRSMTEARFVFLNNWIPSDHPLEGGDFQVYALQLRLAVTERLTLFADRDGIATLSPGAGKSETGLLNLGFGARYLFVRDVERQLLVSGGAMFSPQTGYGNVFQSHGDGTFTVFGTVAKEFAQVNHAILNLGYQFPVDNKDNSSFFYTSLHLDRQMFGWLYPLVELNWYHWTASGDRGIPSAIGEGDGLINIGTSEVAGNDLATVAVGTSALLGNHIETGIAYETPITDREDLIAHRINFHLILRY